MKIAHSAHLYLKEKKGMSINNISEEQNDLRRIADALENIAGSLEVIEDNMNCIIFSDGNNDSYLRVLNAANIRNVFKSSYYGGN